jgi:Sulfotransferase domain.
MYDHHHRSRRIRTWKHFSRYVRAKGVQLLQRLDDFPDSVLVTGCQRSGTTMLAHVITQSDGMVSYSSKRSNELDAALILCGYVNYKQSGRHCFQTTYLDGSYKEYFDHPAGYKVIWMVRNPFSVVYSLTYNWKRFALNELFKGCGAQLLSETAHRWYLRFGSFVISPLRRACLSYNGKLSQVFELMDRLAPGMLMVVDYDNLARNNDKNLKKIYEFIDLPYKIQYASAIHAHSLNNAARLSKRELAIIQEYCYPIYEKARQLIHWQLKT